MLCISFFSEAFLKCVFPSPVFIIYIFIQIYLLVRLNWKDSIFKEFPTAMNEDKSLPLLLFIHTQQNSGLFFLAFLSYLSAAIFITTIAVGCYRDQLKVARFS